MMENPVKRVGFMCQSKSLRDKNAPKDETDLSNQIVKLSRQQFPKLRFIQIDARVSLMAQRSEGLGHKFSMEIMAIRDCIDRF